MTNITVAKNAGFCPGVKNAIDSVLELSKKTGKTIYTLGPLIHNKEVIKSLEQKNILAVEKAQDIKEPAAILVIRAHGIPIELEEQIRKLDLIVVDGTCPLVKSVHKNIEKYRELGYSTVIVGDSDHAEVLGLRGYAKENCYVISSKEEALKLPFLKKVNLVSQTTQEEEVFLDCAEILRTKTEELIISNTICNPTKLRQKETSDFSKKSDLVIVVGGKHSANTKRLYDICSKISKKALLIETPEELNGISLNKYSNIFITAGASTPNWLIDEVFQKTKSIVFAEESKLFIYFAKIWKWTISSGFFTGISAAFLTLASAKFIGCSGLPKKLILSSAFFVLSLHVLNRACEKNSAQNKEILSKPNFSLIKFFAYAFGIGAISLAYATGTKIFFLMAVFWIGGISYPYFLSKHLHKIPASKDFVLATGWTFACAALPIINSNKSFSFLSAVFIAFIFSATLIRSVMLSISQSYNDLLVGKEHLYKNISAQHLYKLIYLPVLLFLILFALDETARNFKMAPIFFFSAYQIFLAEKFKNNSIPDKINSEALIDLQFIVLGASLILF